MGDGSGDDRSAPAPRAPVVPPSAADDGVLRLLVLGDRQARAWAEAARAILEQRLAVAQGPWRGARVDLALRAGDAWTAADALFHLQSGGWDADRPEVVLVALGWEDGGAGRPLPLARSGVDGASTWLAELAREEAIRRADGSEGRFYLNDAGGLPALAPLAHLEFLDTIGIEGAARGAAVVYLEQPVRIGGGERPIFASTGMRPQPWIATTWGMSAQPDPGSLFAGDDPLMLSSEGIDLLGFFVGTGLVQVVLGEPCGAQPAATAAP